jgi:hypothetical protein
MAGRVLGPRNYLNLRTDRLKEAQIPFSKPYYNTMALLKRLSLSMAWLAPPF